LHVAETDGADLAMILGNDHCRAEQPQQFGIDPVNRFATPDYLAYLFVNGPTVSGNVNAWPGQYRQAFDFRGIIALMRSAHQKPAHTQGVDGFGSAGQ
jgi:hypothetical protein